MEGDPPRQAIDAECLSAVGVCVDIYIHMWDDQVNGGDTWNGP